MKNDQEKIEKEDGGDDDGIRGLEPGAQDVNVPAVEAGKFRAFAAFALGLSHHAIIPSFRYHSTVRRTVSFMSKAGLKPSSRSIFEPS